MGHFWRQYHVLGISIIHPKNFCFENFHLMNQSPFKALVHKRGTIAYWLVPSLQGVSFEVGRTGQGSCTFKVSVRSQSKILLEPVLRFEIMAR